MKTIQVVVDAETLRAADREARRAKVNRSELFRRAVRLYLQRARARVLEDKHRAGYERHPEGADEFGGVEAVWPQE
jgi:metal-responsive CopG/Arc/MetJ family transcriptional regulator